MIRPLPEAYDERVFGAKAVNLGLAARAGLPVPEGRALAWALVDVVAQEREEGTEELRRLWQGLTGPVAVRSSAVGEDSAGASFAGQHRSVLNVTSEAGLVEAVVAVWASARTDSALAYRRRLGLDGPTRIGVIVQRLLQPDVAGVLFTRDPVSGSDERVIEASWGFGEAIVAGSVIPDRYRISRSGEVLERAAGFKRVAVRATAGGGVAEVALADADSSRLCLDDAKLGQLERLAGRCEEVFGRGCDLEWAFEAGELQLLQSRPITTSPRRRTNG